MRTFFTRLFGGAADVVVVRGQRVWHRPAFSMLSCGGRDQVARVAASQGWEEFERPTPQFFCRAVQAADRRLVVDVGANTGFYTLLALSVSSRVAVAAYEPLQSARDILQANLALNGLQKRVAVHPDAVSDADGARTLYIPNDAHGQIETSASLAANFKSDIASTHTVAVRKLDTMHGEGPRVAVIKIDAESHDLEVLRGADMLMQRDRPVVFVEVLLGAGDVGLTEILTRCRYQDVVLFPEGVSPRSRRVRHETRAWNHMWLPDESTMELG